MRGLGVEVGSEIFPAPVSDPNHRLGSRLGQRAFAFGHEPVMERVAFARSMQGDGDQAGTDVVTNEFSPGEALAIR